MGFFKKVFGADNQRHRNLGPSAGLFCRFWCWLNGGDGGGIVGGQFSAVACTAQRALGAPGNGAEHWLRGALGRGHGDV